MALTIDRPSRIKKIGPSKIVVGVLVAAMTSLVGLAGVAGATSSQPTDAWCREKGFTNHGQCVKAWKMLNKHNHGHGPGYGGDINLDLDLDIIGNNNTINIIIKYIFGGA